MKFKALFAAAGLAALLPSPALADPTTAQMMSCEVAKGARCKDGKCQWREASARDKAQILVLDLDRKEAHMQRKNKRRKMGIVASDKVANGVRTVVVKRKPDADARHDLVMNIKADGSFAGWRAQKRVQFEGTCKAG